MQEYYSNNFKKLLFLQKIQKQDICHKNTAKHFSTYVL